MAKILLLVQCFKIQWGKPMDAFNEFEEEINAVIEENGSDCTRSEGLVRLFSPLLIERGETSDEINYLAHEFRGRGITKFDAVCFNEQMARIDLIITYLVDRNDEHITNSDIANVYFKAGRVFRAAVNRKFEDFEGEARSVVEMMSDKMSEFSTGRILVLTNAEIKNPEIIADANDIENFTISVRAYDRVRFGKMSEETSSLDDIQITFSEYLGHNLPCVEEKIQKKEYSTYLAVFTGDLIFDLFEEYGTKLFEFNVRSFLQANNKVNKGIRKTLQTEPEKFLAYNNGLVVTVEDMEIESYAGIPAIKSVTGLQIVNGAQTSASIHRAKKIDKVDISTVSVAVKITNITEKELHSDFVKNISQFANNQNNIQPADLSANHPLHIELERLSEAVWCPGERTRWFYERARGAYRMAQSSEGTTQARKREFRKTYPPSQVFKKVDVAKIFQSWELLPHEVSEGAQKNFQKFMQKLDEAEQIDFNLDQEYYKNLIAKFILFKAIERIIRASKFPAYRANIAVYTMSFVRNKAETNLNFDMIWQHQKISDSFEEQLNSLTFDVDKAIRQSAGARNVTEHAKKEACWNDIKSQKMAFDPSLIKEFQDEGDNEDKERNDYSDQDLISWCKGLERETLSRLQLFGNLQGKLPDIEMKIISTVLSYQRAGWIQEPSVKQARRIRSSMEKWQEYKDSVE